jgi:hypothetical protein
VPESLVQAPLICKASLSQKNCEPCEDAAEAMQKMGLDMRMDLNTAQKYCEQVGVVLLSYHVHLLHQQVAAEVSQGHNAANSSVPHCMPTI